MSSEESGLFGRQRRVSPMFVWACLRGSGVALVAVATLALGGAPRVAAAGTPDLQSTAKLEAGITFFDLNGATHSLAEFRGRVVLLEFWATWCVPCRRGFPFLNQLQAAHDDKRFAVVALSLEEEEQTVRHFLESVPAKVFVGRDPTGRAGLVFGVQAMPTSVLLDPDGAIIRTYSGGTDAVHQQVERDVTLAIDGRLAAQPASAPKAAPTTGLHAWQRGYLADPIMNLDGDVLTRSIRDHIHSSKEGASGNGGVAGGGCGCN